MKQLSRVSRWNTVSVVGWALLKVLVDGEVRESITFSCAIVDVTTACGPLVFCLSGVGFLPVSDYSGFHSPSIWFYKLLLVYFFYVFCPTSIPFTISVSSMNSYTEQYEQLHWTVWTATLNSCRSPVSYVVTKRGLSFCWKTTPLWLSNVDHKFAAVHNKEIVTWPKEVQSMIYEWTWIPFNGYFGYKCRYSARTKQKITI